MAPWRGVTAAVLVALGPGCAAAQETLTQELTGPVVSTIAAGVTAVAPGLLHINERAPECAPCDPTTIPSFDRWVVRPPVRAWSTITDIAVTGLATATWIDMSRGDNGLRRVAASIEAVAWAVGLSQVTKAVVGRKRPVLYTVQAPTAAGDLSSRRSFPSGHTAVAFALATTYWLDAAGRRGPEHWLAFAGATFIGVARVASADHFPSDVVIGALVGSGTAIVVHEIRF